MSTLTRRIARALTPAALALLSSSLPAQVPVEWTEYLSPAAPASAGWGDGLATADLNSDGFDDLIVAEPQATVGGLPFAGRMWVLYGPLPLKASLSFAASQPVQAEQLGAGVPYGYDLDCISAGDVDQDGHADLLVGAPNYKQWLPLMHGIGRAHLFFGPDFTQEVVFHDPTPETGGRFGRTTLLADVTGDGRLDVLVGAPAASAPGPGHVMLNDVGEVWVWKSDDGFQVPSHLAVPHPSGFAAFGSSLDVVALHGQQPDTLLIGAPHQSPGFGYGVIHAYRLPDLSPLATIAAPQLPTGVAVDFGDTVHCGDLTADGINDLVVTAPGSYIDCGSQGAVILLEGPSFHSVLNVLTSPESCGSSFSGFFGHRTAVADFDADGAADVIVADVGHPNQRIYVFYGSDFTRAQVLDEAFTFGLAGHLAIDDWDGDGRVEVAVGRSPSVHVGEVRSLLADVDSLSTSAGTTATFALDATPALAGGAYLAALSASGSEPGFVPTAGVYLPLNYDALTGIGLTLVNGPLLPGFVGVLDSTGKAAFQLVLPPGSIGALLGQTLTVAAVAADADGHVVAGSSAVELLVGP